MNAPKPLSGSAKITKYGTNKRDGTGPRKGSYQREVVGKGRRQMAGETCPVKKKGKK